MKKLLLTCAALPSFCFGIEEMVTITRVVDGDTVIIERDNGSQERLRIVGIDTPEIVANNRPVECYGSEASTYAKQLLPTNSTVTFVHENKKDKYDRSLGYLSLVNGEDFGEVMIRDGYAYAYRSFNHKRRSLYIRTESQARLQKNGLWDDDACRYSEQSIDQTVSTWRDIFNFFHKARQIIESILSIIN